MKTLNIDRFETLTAEELVTINGGAGLSSLNSAITGLFNDLSVASLVSLAAASKTITDLTSNADGATNSGSLLGGGLLGGSGNGLLGGGVNF
jgi:hypothetical protein